MPSSDTQFKKGVCPPTAFKKGHTPVIKGKHHRPESRIKMSETKKGIHYSPRTEFKKGEKSVGVPFKKGHVPFYKGKKNPKVSGEKHWNYKGGISVRYMAKNAPRPKPKECEICQIAGVIVFDHNHKNNKFRGWLCSPCNTVLGFVKDNPMTLEKLAKYLKENE